MKLCLRIVCVFVLWSVQADATEKVQTRAETTITKSNPQETTTDPVSTASPHLINPTDLKDALDQLAKEINAISALVTEAKRTADQQRCEYGKWWCRIKDFQGLAGGTGFFAAIFTAIVLYVIHLKKVKAVERGQRDQEERVILRHRVRWAGSFLGEVSSFCDLVKRRNVYGIYRDQLNALRTRKYALPLIKFPTVEYYFNIYRATCRQLGTFEDENLPKQITTFYTDSIAFMDYLKAISKGSFDEYPRIQQVPIIQGITGDVCRLLKQEKPLIRALENEISRAKVELTTLADSDEKLDLSDEANDGRTKTFNSDGIEIAFIDRGKGGPVLLIHGFASNMTDNWVDSNWVERLNKAGYRVIAYDNRGHGMSEKSYDKAFYGTEKMAEDAWRLLNHLQIERANIIGYSMGALIAARLTIRHPDRVRHAIFGGYGINMVNGVTTEALIVEAMEAESIDELTNELARTLRTTADRTRSNRRALAACAHVAAETIPREDLVRINVPVLVAVGTADTISGSAEELAKLMSGAQYLNIPERGHIEAVSDPVFKEGVLEFLSGRS